MRNSGSWVGLTGVVAGIWLAGSPARAQQCSVNWKSVTRLPGAYNFVYAMEAYDDGTGPALYAGGWFTTDQASVSANHILKWNGTSWLPLGDGITGLFSRVQSMAVYNGELIVGGTFTSAGGIHANNIAKWNGTTWSPWCSPSCVSD